MRAAKDEQALSLLDDAIKDAVHEDRQLWISILCSHAATISHHIGDRQREIHYNQLGTADSLPRGGPNYADWRLGSTYAAPESSCAFCLST